MNVCFYLINKTTLIIYKNQLKFKHDNSQENLSAIYNKYYYKTLL